MSEAGRETLRRTLLVVSVLHDVDFDPTDDGIVLTGPIPVKVTWAQCRQALADGCGEEDDEPKRLARWLRARGWLTRLTSPDMAERARPVGLPRDHALHPGPDWVREKVPGGSLDLGMGIVGLDPETPHEVTVVPASLWAAADIDPALWWPPARAYLDLMTGLALQRWHQDPRAVLRPMGHCDVTTLLASAEFRTAIAGRYEGMAAMVVPMRSRGWAELRAIDPAFAVVAAAATSPEERGFVGPLLVTSEEIVLVTGQITPNYR